MQINTKEREKKIFVKLKTFNNEKTSLFVGTPMQCANCRGL